MESIRRKLLRTRLACLLLSLTLIVSCSENKRLNNNLPLEEAPSSEIAQSDVSIPLASSPDQRMGAGILNNEVPPAHQIETLRPLSESSVYPFDGLWLGYSQRAGDGFETTKKHSLRLDIDVENDNIKSITVTNQFGDISQAKDVNFKNGLLTFEFLSGVTNAAGDPFPQFADLLVVDGKVRGLLRLRVDDRKQFDISVKEILWLEKVDS